LQRGEERLEYLRNKGVWRCHSVFGAVAREDLVLSLLNATVFTEGVVHSEDPSQPERYGLGTSETITLTLYGTQFRKQADEDLLLALEIGRSIPGGDGCYARFPGERAVWALAADLRAMIGWKPAPALAPLLDPFLVPKPWADSAESILRVLVERPSGPGFELALAFTPPDEVARGAPEWQWMLNAGGQVQAADPVLGVGYTLFLRRAPYVGIVDPQLAEKLIAPSPQARIRIVPRRGEPEELVLGPPVEGGAVPVFSSIYGQLFLVEPEVAELLLPETSAFESLENGNPWDPWLQRGPGE
jgi:hypothetical protein